MAQRGAETVRLIFFCVSHMHGSVALTLFSSPPIRDSRACVRVWTEECVGRGAVSVDGSRGFFGID